jgi:hypothetical protein
MFPGKGLSLIFNFLPVRLVYARPNIDMQRYRKYVTSGVGFTFLVVGVTGVIFQFFFKNRVLEHIHGWLGVALVVIAVLHIRQNWRPLRHHLRDWRVYGLLVPILVTVAYLTFGQADPRRQGRSNMNPREVMGKLAKASAEDVAKVFGKDIDAVYARMKKDGLQAGDKGKSVQELAADNDKPAEGILIYFVK